MIQMLYIFTLFFFFDTVFGISCKNELGENVPTWTIMKLPQGTRYYYYDPINNYTFSQNSLNDTVTGALSYTLKQLWIQNTNYIIYNDEPPNQEVYNFSVAHSKAVWMWDNTNAILITHSIPKFPQGPNLKGEYTGLMENAWDYGQTATCLQLSLSALPNALNLVYETNPLIYDISYTINKTHIQSTNKCSNYIIDNTYIMFMKPSSYKVDIWSSCISEYFSSNISVESWIHGSQDGAYCSPKYSFETFDIQSLQFPEGQTFTEYDDHSKWGILENPIVCFGDLNRVASQMERAGSVYCWKNSNLWDQLNQLIVSTNSC
jgi:hypothetical protein